MDKPLKKKVLIVNGNGPVRDTLASIVEGAGYVPSIAPTGREAIKIVMNSAVDLVLAESYLKDYSGVELKKRIMRISRKTRVIVVNNFSVITSSDDVLRFGASDYIVDQRELVELIRYSLEEKTPVSLPVTDEELKTCLIDTMDILIGLLEVNDPFFSGNSHVTMEYAKSVAEAMELEKDIIDEIIVASLLHDIGKIGVKKEILVEKEELSETDLASIRGHCENGVAILETINFPWKIKPIIMHHHERYDGNGYPSGLKGREIPLGARILSVVDAFAAMTANRPHRSALSKEEALKELHGNVGTQFDPEVVEIFTRVVETKFSHRGVTSRAKVLIVDDEIDYLTLLKLKLANEGFEVDATDNGREALDMIRKDRYDLAIIDVGIPGKTGMDVLREMKQDSGVEDVPVIFLSGMDEVESKVEALHLGAEDYLLKPVNMKELAARARNIIRRDSRRKKTDTGFVNPGVVGDLKNLGLTDIVQTLHLGLKTALVTLKNGDDVAKIFFENGRIKHCSYRDLQGESAFYELLKWENGDFVIEHGIKTKEQTVTMDGMQMLMEGLRRLDEEARDKAY